MIGVPLTIQLVAPWGFEGPPAKYARQEDVRAYVEEQRKQGRAKSLIPCERALLRASPLDVCSSCSVLYPSPT
jgi:hypothetical protein